MRAADVRDAIADGDLERALDLALAAWRHTRSAAVSAVVEQIDQRLAVPIASARTRQAFHAAWMARAAAPTPVEVGWLARTLDERVPLDEEPRASFQVGYQARRYRPWFDRLAALTALPPDPRIGSAAMRVLEHGRLSVGWFEEAELVYGPAAALVERCMDAGLFARARALVERPRATRAAVRAWLTDRCGRFHAPTGAPLDDESAWSAWLEPEARPGPTATELHSAILEDPMNLDLRSVYADALQEAGDPRGEFIALQLFHGATGARGRARSLLREHLGDWIGPDLVRVLTTVELRGGFLHGAALAQNAAADAESWARASSDPRLATLVRLEKGRANLNHYLAFLTSPTARALADIDVPTAAALQALMDCPIPRRFERLRFARLPALRALRPLATHPHFAPWRAVKVGAGPTAGALDDVRRIWQTLADAGLARVRDIEVAWWFGGSSAPEVAKVFDSLDLAALALGRGEHVLRLSRVPGGARIEAGGVGIASASEVADAIEGPLVEVRLVEQARPGPFVPATRTVVDALRRTWPDVEVEVVRPE